MPFFPKIFLNKKPIEKNLEKYGFKKSNNTFIFSKNIMKNVFCLTVFIDAANETSIKITDTDTNDEYTLAYNENYIGGFVGKVRAEVEIIERDIIDKCYEMNFSKNDYCEKIINYIKVKYNLKPEYLWDKTPNSFIFRNSENRKWFAAVLEINKKKLGINDEGTTEIINLKDEPEIISEIIDEKTYFKGYHMNKKHWYSICLNASIPIEKIYSHIDKSFSLISKK